MGNLCIIPARGGSKRIPRKNIKEFLGKPIIAYSIEVALKSGLFDEVMVSTDDKEVADIARRYGAKVPFIRSKKNSNDFATTYDVIEEVILKYNELNIYFDLACCIYPCAPFVTKEKLTDARLLMGDFDMVMPVMEFSFPIQRALKVGTDHTLSLYNLEYELSRSQDVEKTYHDSGQFYWFKVGELLKAQKLILPKSGAVVIKEGEGQDIDSQSDWELAELKYKLLYEIS